MQLKHSLRELKEQDLELASKAEYLTDQELSLLDIKRLSIPTTRKAKHQILQQRHSSDQADWTSIHEPNPQQSEGPPKTDTSFWFTTSHFDTPTRSPASDPQKEARSKTRHSQSFTIQGKSADRDHFDDSGDKVPKATKTDDDCQGR